jgi:hypothetical protein
MINVSRNEIELADKQLKQVELATRNKELPVYMQSLLEQAQKSVSSKPGSGN